MRIQLTISEEERLALNDLSRMEARQPADQARLILRRELERRGYLPQSGLDEAKQTPRPIFVILNQAVEAGND